MPATIDVSVNHACKGCSVSQLAVELGINRSNCRRYINRLIDNGHKHFRDYAKGDPLTQVQKDVVTEFRRLSVEDGKRSDGLWRAIKDYPRPPSYRLIALAEICDRYGVSSDLIEQMVQEVTEIFEQ